MAEDEEKVEQEAETEEPAAEEKPKRRRRVRRKKAEEPAAEAAADEPATEEPEAAAEQPEPEAAAEQPEPEAAAEQPEPEAEAEEPEEAKEAADEEEAEAEEAEVEGEPEPEKPDATPKRSARRGGEAVAGRRRRAAPAPRTPEGDITVRARARYVRCAPRKARLVIDHIRGRSVGEARAILQHTPRAASRDVLKLLDSAVANAENNHDLVADDLKVGRAYVDEGPTLKRFRPRALGRATRIRKRTSHMTIELTAKE